MKTNQKKIMDEGTKKPHPAPDPTRPDRGKPGTKIPVSPDEDNDFTTPNKEVEAPENPSPVQVPSREKQATTEAPQNTPKNDPDRISPATPRNPALSTNSKRILFGIILAFLLSFQQVNADNRNTDPLNTSRIENKEVIQLYKRLETIRAINKSELSRTQKKELRNEVKDIRHKLADTGGGIYLSAGALIIIIILLIILL
jgi:hypothetical protein